MYRKRREIPLNSKCPFCPSAGKAGVGGKPPDYKEVETLRKYLSDRGKILSRGRSGVCAKHQRQLAQAIKRARYLSLLPFVVKI